MEEQGVYDVFNDRVKSMYAAHLGLLLSSSNFEGEPQKFSSPTYRETV